MENLFTNASQLLLTGLITISLVALIFFMIRRKKHKKERRIIDSILDAAAIPVYRKSLPQLKREIARVRRYQHPLSVVVIQPAVLSLSLTKTDVKATSNHKTARNGKHNNGESTGISQIEFMLCGPIFRDALRELDRTTYDGANNRFVLVLPESSKIQAVQTVNRLKRILGEKIFDRLQVGIAEFPADGLIIEDLVCRAIPAPGQKISAESNLKSAEEMVVKGAEKK